MKLILTLVLLSARGLTASASDTTIAFRQIKYAELFEAAKKENKGIMLYFHYDGCAACVTMERTAFKNKSVIDYYNTNFINFEINTLKGEGIEINKIYNIELHPTFIYFDNEGNELHRLVGVFSPENFYTQAKDALLFKKNLANYKRQYLAGNREPGFLFDYSYMLRDANELDSIVVNEYLESIEESSFPIEKNIRYIYEFCIHNFSIFIPYHNPKFRFLLKNKELFYRQLDSNQVKTRIVWILNTAVFSAIKTKDENTFKEAIEILKEYDTGQEYLFKETDGRVTGMITSKNLVLSAMIRYYESKGDHPNYLKTLDLYISKIWNSADDLNNFAWNVYLQAQDDEMEKIKTAIKCSIRSIELNNNYSYNDTYAWLLYKSGEKKKALKQADKTIEIAKKNNQDYSETQKLVALIKKKS